MSLRDYIFENIFSNRLTQDDVRLGKTGFKYWDSLTQEERDNQTKKFHEEIKPTISSEEFAKMIFDTQAEIRKKKRENNGALKNVDDIDAYLEIINNDIPKQWEHGVKDLASVDFGLAARLKDKKIQGTYEDVSSVIDELEKELAAIIKKWEREDPTFENTIIPYNYGGDRKEFDELVARLKKKGFL